MVLFGNLKINYYINNHNKYYADETGLVGWKDVKKYVKNLINKK